MTARLPRGRSVDLGEAPTLRSVHDLIVRSHGTRAYEIHPHRTPVTGRIADIRVEIGGEP